MIYRIDADPRFPPFPLADSDEMREARFCAGKDTDAASYERAHLSVRECLMNTDPAIQRVASRGRRQGRRCGASTGPAAGAS